MNVSAPTEWLSLKEASEVIGVHPSTLRRWADAGTIPCTRTPGGHRRFRRAALSQYLARKGQPLAEHPGGEGPASPGHTAISPGGEMEAVMPPEWHAPFAEAAVVGRMRELGQRLLGLLLQYLTRPGEDERFLKQGREVGYDYGHESYSANIGLLDAVEAFLYFRTNFAQTALELPGVAAPTDGHERVQLHQRIDRFMDGVLLGFIAAYEEARGYLTQEGTVT